MTERKKTFAKEPAPARAPEAGVAQILLEPADGDAAVLFAMLNGTAKLYHRKDGGTPRRLSMARFLPPSNERTTTALAPGDISARFSVLTERTLLQKYIPAGALVNDRGDILYLHGRTGQYLEPAPGEAGLNILKMARLGLRPGLTTALYKAVAKNEPVSVAGLRVKTNGGYCRVNLKIQPVVPGAEEAPLYLVILEEAPEAPAATSTARGAATSKAVNARIKEPSAHATALKKELRDKGEYLQTTTEELEARNEELKSANKEMQSINEEMQSTSEELETSQKELQSFNQELATVNAELQGKVGALSQANNHMNNLLAGSGAGTIFVNHQLQILRFTPSITEVINLISTDVGRPLGDIVSNLTGYSDLVDGIQRVLDTLVPAELEVENTLGKWYILRIRAYRTLENVIEGAVITFSEITEMKKAREALQQSAALRRLAVVVTDSRDAILVQDMDGRIVGWNPAATRLYGWSEAEALAMNVSEIIPPARQQEALKIVRQMSHADVPQPYRMDRLAKDGRIVPVSLAATALVDEAGAVYAIATTERGVA